MYILQCCYDLFIAVQDVLLFSLFVTFFLLSQDGLPRLSCYRDRFVLLFMNSFVAHSHLLPQSQV